MNEIKSEGDAMTNKAERACRCPDCGSNAPSKRLRVNNDPNRPYALGKWCVNHWHDAPTAASAGTPARKRRCLGLEEDGAPRPTPSEPREDLAAKQKDVNICVLNNKRDLPF